MIGKDAAVMVEAMLAGVAVPSVMPCPVRLSWIFAKLAGSLKSPFANFPQSGGAPGSRPVSAFSSASLTMSINSVLETEGALGSR